MRRLRAERERPSSRKKVEYKTCQKPCEKHYAAEAQKHIKKTPFWEPKFLKKSTPEASGSALGASCARPPRQKLSKSALGERLGATKRPSTRPRRPKVIFQAFSSPRRACQTCVSMKRKARPKDGSGSKRSCVFSCFVFFHSVFLPLSAWRSALCLFLAFASQVFQGRRVFAVALTISRISDIQFSRPFMIGLQAIA